MMSSYKRFGCVGLSVILGLLLVTLLQSSLALASSAAPSAALSPALRGLSAARALPPGSPDAASVILTKTVGTDPGLCASAHSIELPAGSTATYCYTIRNNGTVTLTTHTLVDNRLGVLLTNFPFALVPGASAFLTHSAIITQNTVNSATWSADGPGVGAPVSASDQATVTVQPLSIILTKTVGIDPGECATTSSLELEAPGLVIYCYHIQNSGAVTLTRHYLVDNRLGTILTNFPFTLGISATAFLTQSAMITQTIINTATWSATTSFSVLTPTASSSARVLLVVQRLYLPMLRN